MKTHDSSGRQNFVSIGKSVPKKMLTSSLEPQPSGRRTPVMIVSSHVDETSQEESFDHLVRDSFVSDLTVSLNEDHLFGEILARK